MVLTLFRKLILQSFSLCKDDRVTPHIHFVEKKKSGCFFLGPGELGGQLART